MVEPLCACLRNYDFCWSEKAQGSFTTVRKMLVNWPCLIQSILPSSPLTPPISAERKYSTVEKEVLGYVWVVENWRTYLWGRKFTLRTDLRTSLTTNCLLLLYKTASSSRCSWKWLWYWDRVCCHTVYSPDCFIFIWILCFLILQHRDPRAVCTDLRWLAAFSFCPPARGAELQQNKSWTVSERVLANTLCQNVVFSPHRVKP